MSEFDRPVPAVGQKWRLRRDSEGHKAGEVVTVLTLELSSNHTFDTCRADKCRGHGPDTFLRCEDWADAEFLGSSLTPLKPLAQPTKTRWAESCDKDGAPVSARAILEMRERLSKPEPWRPSVDEWDLLPDAGR